VKEDSEIGRFGSTAPFWGVTRVAIPSKSKRGSKERPMNSGIIRTALTTTLALELEYREPSIVREIGAEADPPTEPQSQGRMFECEFACLMSMGEKAENL
jgi:hypothetical protein